MRRRHHAGRRVRSACNGENCIEGGTACPTPTRVALITGCGKPIGIGNSTARALAAKGVTVVVSDLRPAGVANEHNAPGDTRHQLGRGRQPRRGRSPRPAAPLRRSSAMSARRRTPARMVGEVLSRYGRLDILVNNAGAPQGADRNEIEDVPVAAWDLTMGVNAKGAFLMSRAAVPAMRKAGFGRIVSVSSKAAFRPGQKRATYAASKAAIVGFTRSLALDLAPHRDHGQRGLPRADPHLARDQHQPARIRRRPRSRLPRAGEGDPRRPLRQPRRSRLDDRLSRLRRSRLRHRPGDRRRRRVVSYPKSLRCAVACSCIDLRRRASGVGAQFV